MRPNKLIMSAFGPYAGKVVVELDKLGENGLYLITGDTGAGKTTIFDAITYALFGEASGENRETSMFRSKYAAPKTPTEVELYFTYAGKEYYIKRNPEYDRPRTKGEGYTTEKANAELHLPDKRVITKRKEVNNAIVDIIGVDKNQFSQIAMIAQGDFLKLLLASTDERKKIFQKLFKTQNYYILQENLKQESGKLGREYDTIKNSIEQYVNGIVCDEENFCFDEVCSAKNGDLPIDEIVKLLEGIISEDEKFEKTLAEEKEKLQKEINDINACITRAESIILAKADLEKNEIDLKVESENEIKLKEKLKLEEERLPYVKEFTEKAAKIKAFLPDYDELSEKQCSFNNNKIFIDGSDEKTERIKENIEALNNEIIELKEEDKTFDKVGEEKLKLENEKKKEEEKKAKLKKLDSDIDDAIALSAQSEKAREEYNKKYYEVELLDSELKEKTRIYLEAQAGILAETLEPNKPCPVCGSTVHPCIAKKPVDVPTKEELDNFQKKLNQANEIVNDARTKAGKLKGAANEKEESVKKEIAMPGSDASLNDAKAAVAVRISDIDSQIEDFDKKMNEIQKKIERKEEICELLPEKTAELESVKEDLIRITDEVKARKIKNETLEKRITELKTKLAFATKSDAENQIIILNNEAEDIQKGYDEILKEVNGNKEKLVSLKSAREEILKRIGDGTDVDMEEEKKSKRVLEEKQAEIDEKSKTAYSRKTSNKLLLDNILQKLDEIKNVEEKWTWMKALSNTANGNLSGREKVMLETYIQTTYFDRIINRANTRLMVMSGGQYELKRRKEAENNRSQSGLELDVIDHYNGSERSVKTLSGGESFKASLSLALGLSDEIQSSAGGIKLDTMFVDEGFGSLDDESLSQAIKALSSLAEGNRLIGIISHVNELKERIEKQIVVKKEKTDGSSICIVT